MTRADSIAAGLIVVPTADGQWDDNGTYDLDGNRQDTLGVGGTDSDLDSPWGE